MSDAPMKTAVPTRPPKGSGAALLTFGGLAAAFGVGSCCALPLLLTSLGVGTAWLSGIALVAAPQRVQLLGIGALGLLGGAVLLWRLQREASSRRPEGARTSGAVRGIILVGLLIGAALLWAGYTYV